MESIGIPVLGSPVLGSPVLRSPVLGSPVLGSPVLGSPVLRSPVLGSPVLGFLGSCRCLWFLLRLAKLLFGVDAGIIYYSCNIPNLLVVIKVIKVKQTPNCGSGRHLTC